jgi:regulator of replication initiation timing
MSDDNKEVTMDHVEALLEANAALKAENKALLRRLSELEGMFDAVLPAGDDDGNEDLVMALYARVKMLAFADTDPRMRALFKA